MTIVSSIGARLPAPGWLTALASESGKRKCCLSPRWTLGCGGSYPHRRVMSIKAPSSRLLQFMPRFVVLIALITPALTGCLTIGGEPNPSLAPSAALHVGIGSDLDMTYERLGASAVGQLLELGTTDGFGERGVKLVRRYFSASGKRCLVARDIITGADRTYCRDANGNVNVLDDLDMRGDRGNDRDL